MNSALLLSLSYLIVVFFLPFVLYGISSTLIDLRDSNWLVVVVSLKDLFSFLTLLLFMVLVMGVGFGVAPFFVIGSLTGILLGYIVAFMERRNMARNTYLAVALLLSIFSLIWALYCHLLNEWAPETVVAPILIYFVTCLFITRQLIAEARRMREAAA